MKNILQVLIDVDNIDHLTHAEQIKRVFDPAEGVRLLRQAAENYPETAPYALSVGHDSAPDEIRAVLVRVRNVIFDRVQ